MKPKLTGLQRKLVRQIRELFSRGEPLNICAVKRNHPELMKAVYTVKPFWGWKRALEAAGIDYSKIKVQLEPYHKCRICGEEFVELGYHIRMIHGADKHDYGIDYPGAPLTSEERRARASRMKSRIVEHWEPLWTPEYVMDRIAEFRGRNLPVNEEWVRRNELNLQDNAISYFGNWRAALRAVGLDPDAIHREFTQRYPSKQKAIEGIRERCRRGLQVTATAVTTADSKSRDYALWRTAETYFGSWPAALTAAGIDHARIRKMMFLTRRRYPDRQSVIREIRRRRAAGLDVHRAGVKRANQALEKSGIEYFGSWNAPLMAAGVDPRRLISELFRKLRRYPDRQAVVSEIERRVKGGLAVNASTVILRENLLWTSARRFFGSWHVALKAAGLDPAHVRGEMFLRHWRYPDKKAVVREIRRRRRAGLPLAGSGLHHGAQGGRTLYKTARALFSSWPNALKAAGIDPDTIQRRSR